MKLPFTLLCLLLFVHDTYTIIEESRLSSSASSSSSSAPLHHVLQAIIQEKKHLNFQGFVDYHQREVPTAAIAANRVDRAVRENPLLGSFVARLQDPTRYKDHPYPTRLLFTGPSGGGKTELALCLAKHCNMQPIFIKGTSIRDVCAGNGSNFIQYLFENLRAFPDGKFMVIIDAIATLATTVSEDDAETAETFIHELNRIEDKQHICVVGTDTGPVDMYRENFKRAFAGYIFTLSRSGGIPTIINLIKERLNYNPEGTPIEHLHTCSDEFITNMAQLMSHLSLREIKNRIEEVKIAALCNNNTHTVVEKRHFQTILEELQVNLSRTHSDTITTCIDPNLISNVGLLLGSCLKFWPSKNVSKIGLSLLYASLMCKIIYNKNLDTAYLPIIILPFFT